MKTAWSKLRLALTKRCFLLISQLLSRHLLSWYHADNFQTVKSMVDAPHYVRTVKRAKRSRKFNAGVLKKKWAGHGKLRVISQAATLQQLLCLVMLKSGDKVVDVAKFLKLSFRFFTLTYKLLFYFRELIFCKVDGYRWRI
jgi:hypothetical protein